LILRMNTKLDTGTIHQALEFKFEDTTVSHIEPYNEARIFYEYSTNGGVSWVRDMTQTDSLQNSLEFNLPSQSILNGQIIKIRWGYIRAHDIYSTSSTYQQYSSSTYYKHNEPPYEYLNTAGLTSNGLYFSRFDDSSTDPPSGDFNANFINHVMVNTTDVQVDCDPDSEYSQTLTTCECDDLGATSTLSITNNDNYTSYYKVSRSLLDRPIRIYLNLYLTEKRLHGESKILPMVVTSKDKSGKK